MPVFAKMKMRREAEQHRNPEPPAPPPGEPDPAARPLLAAETDAEDEADAAADWLAHLEAGRIAVD